MDREALRALPREELIDRVIRLREMLALVERLQATIERLERQVVAQVAEVARLAERAQPAADAIREAIGASPVINSHETSVRVDGKNHSHWCSRLRPPAPT